MEKILEQLKNGNSITKQVLALEALWWESFDHKLIVIRQNNWNN